MSDDRIESQILAQTIEINILQEKITQLQSSDISQRKEIGRLRSEYARLTGEKADNLRTIHLLKPKAENWDKIKKLGESCQWVRLQFQDEEGTPDFEVSHNLRYGSKSYPGASIEEALKEVPSE